MVKKVQIAMIIPVKYIVRIFVGKAAIKREQ